MNNLLNPVFRQVALRGRNKILYKGEQVGDFVLAFDDEDPQMSMIRNKISNMIFELLSECGVQNHFIKPHGIKEQTVVALEMLPFMVEMHSHTNADLAKRFHCQEGVRFKNYLMEIKIKDAKQEYSLISQDHIINFEWVNNVESAKIVAVAHRVMDILYGFFRAYDCTLNSVRLEFGRRYVDGVAKDILIADEMSPKNLQFTFNDVCDLNENDLYIEMAKRLGILKYE